MSNTIESFEDFKLNRQILNAIEEEGYQTPTEIQKKAMPLITAGHDVMGIAQTGTGKTAAFVLPILMKVKYHQSNGPRAVIMTPTRELAMQIRDHIAKFCTYLDLRYAAIYGGSGTKMQRQSLEGGVDILVATPGRFMDFYRERLFPTKYIKTLVLDEADKMMDMGFMPQLRNLLEIIPVKRQNLLFSATMPDKVITLSQEFLEFPEKVEVTPDHTVAETVEHFTYRVPNLKTKINLLTHLLRSFETDDQFSKAIIFTKTKANADNVYKYILRKVSKEVKVIHGNKDQNTRSNAMREFSEGGFSVLVATDVVARGIDISAVSHVINFDVPVIYEDYVHRIGRTGRAERSGIAVTFVNPAEEYHMKAIEKLINQSISVAPLPENVIVEKTDREENQLMAREIDGQKKKENPDYKGAFHQKKVKSKKPIKANRKQGKKTRNRR
ncbi:MAG: DEAD/DEAH box helicase [Bacteroidota bacterium]